MFSLNTFEMTIEELILYVQIDISIQCGRKVFRLIITNVFIRVLLGGVILTKKCYMNKGSISIEQF